MPTVNEAAGGRGQFAAVLATGLETLSQQQTITFTTYRRVVLPADGFVFWIKDDILNPSALLNTGRAGAVRPGQGVTVNTQAPTVTVKGSLHYTTENQQDETEGYATNNVVFTSETEVEALTNIAPRTILVGEFDGFQFAFSRRSSLYRQAQLYHYSGFAVYPSMATQIIDNPAALNTRDVIVSNSLPFWLQLNQFAPMYPSFLVDDNIDPPWCAVHIEPGGTDAMGSAPYIDKLGNHTQLVRDRVKLTFYGLRNNAALDFVDYVNAYTLNTDNFGIMNMPVMRDEKATQAELNIISQKKTIEYEISYYQSRAQNVARQLITDALITIYPEED